MFYRNPFEMDHTVHTHTMLSTIAIQLHSEKLSATSQKCHQQSCGTIAVHIRIETDILVE